MHAYQSPKGDGAPNGGATAPGPQGLRPPPLPLRSGRFPCYLPSGRSVCKNHGGASAGRAKRKPAVGRWATACSCPWGNPEGEASGRESPARYSASGSKTLKLGVAKPPQKPRRAHDFPWESVMSPLIAESGRMARMAHFAILSAEAQVRGGGPSLHEAQLQSAGHAKRERRADAPQRSISARTAWPRAWPHSGRGCRRASARMLSRRSVPDNSQSRPCKASRKAAGRPTSGTR